MKKVNTKKSDGTNDLERLRQRKIAAEHDYLVCLRSIYATRFDRETDQYVFDDQHWGFKVLFGEGKRNVAKDVNLYRKAVSITHPDKCDAPWAERVTQEINHASDSGDINTLKEMHAYYKEHATFEGYVKGNGADGEGEKVVEDSLEKQNERITCSLWYGWYFGDMKPILQKCFIPAEEYAKRTARYEEEKKMKENIERLRAVWQETSDARSAAAGKGDPQLFGKLYKDADAAYDEMNACINELEVYREKHKI